MSALLVPAAPGVSFGSGRARRVLYIIIIIIIIKWDELDRLEAGRRVRACVCVRQYVRERASGRRESEGASEREELQRDREERETWLAREL